MGRTLAGSDSHVLRPMITACCADEEEEDGAVVSALKCFMSEGRRHGICWRRPMPPVASSAATTTRTERSLMSGTAERLES